MWVRTLCFILWKPGKKEGLTGTEGERIVLLGEEKRGESHVGTHWTVTNQSSLFLSWLVQQEFNRTHADALPVMLSWGCYWIQGINVYLHILKLSSNMNFRNVMYIYTVWFKYLVQVFIVVWNSVHYYFLLCSYNELISTMSAIFNMQYNKLKKWHYEMLHLMQLAFLTPWTVLSSQG